MNNVNSDGMTHLARLFSNVGVEEDLADFWLLKFKEALVDLLAHREGT